MQRRDIGKVRGIHDLSVRIDEAVNLRLPFGQTIE